MALVGYNILAMVVYTLFCKTIGGDSGIIFDAFLIFFTSFFAL